MVGGVGPELEVGRVGCEAWMRLMRSFQVTACRRQIGRAPAAARPSCCRSDGGLGAGEEEAGAVGRSVGEFDVVHDDEVVEVG